MENRIQLEQYRELLWKLRGVVNSREEYESVETDLAQVTLALAEVQHGPAAH